MHLNFTMKISGLEEANITKMEQMEERLTLHVEVDVQILWRPSCQMKTRPIHDYRVKSSSI